MSECKVTRKGSAAEGRVCMCVGGCVYGEREKSERERIYTQISLGFGVGGRGRRATAQRCATMQSLSGSQAREEKKKRKDENTAQW